jgi:hypothetical protein
MQRKLESETIEPIVESEVIELTGLTGVTWGS